MDKNVRSIAKTATWRVIGIGTTLGVTYLLTGSIGISLAVAGVREGIAILGYFIHERIWNRVRWGTTDEPIRKN